MLQLKVRQILLPTDFSETARNALQHALKIAIDFNATLTLLHVKENYSHEMLVADVQAHELDVSDEYEQVVTRMLEEWQKQCMDAGLEKVNLVIANGRIPQEIKNYAIAENVDLVVMGTHGAGGDDDEQMGSNLYKVLNTLTCPVLAVRNETPVIGYNTVVVPMDETPASRQKISLCADWGKIFRSHLKLICLCEVADSDYIKYVDNVCSQVSVFLTEENVAFSVNHIEAENTALEVVRYAEYTDSDLIVIMSEKETTIDSSMVGSYALQVISHSRVPVLIVHPEDGSSPFDISG